MEGNKVVTFIRKYLLSTFFQQGVELPGFYFRHSDVSIFFSFHIIFFFHIIFQTIRIYPSLVMGR